MMSWIQSGRKLGSGKVIIDQLGSGSQSLEPRHAMSDSLHPPSILTNKTIRGTEQQKIIDQKSSRIAFKMIFLGFDKPYILLQDLTTIEISQELRFQSH
jgi:hypothetical protein